MSVAALLSDVLGPDVPVAFRAYDGSRFGPDDARTTIVVRSRDALRRIVTAPNELGFGRAYVAGDREVEGDIFDVISVANYIEELRLGPKQIAAALRLVGVSGLQPLAPPPEEARMRGRRHSRARDAAAISHHYDMLLHAAERHGVHAVGVTLSEPQAELARKRAAERGLGDLLEVRFGDYRDVDDGPYDAISSIGMFEHVGLSELDAYFRRCHALLRPEGRLLNHGISRPAHVEK